MATWPPPPAHFREARSGGLQPPPLPAPGASYGCFGERFPREAHRPPLLDDSSDTAATMRELHGAFAGAYLELLTAMTTAPSGVYELQLKVQSLEEIITRLQQLLADDARHWEAGEALVQAVRAQTARKAELALALDAASDAAERQLRELLGPAPADATADATSGAPPRAGGGEADAMQIDGPAAQGLAEPAGAMRGASGAQSARVRAVLDAVERALDAAASR